MQHVAHRARFEDAGYKGCCAVRMTNVQAETVSLSDLGALFPGRFGKNQKVF